MIGIIDYDAGNIKSVEKALHYLGEETVVSRDPQVLLKADKVILPGVGSFGQAMENLHTYGLVPVIHEMVEKKTPFLGICLGLQLLFESSEDIPEQTYVYFVHSYYLQAEDPEIVKATTQYSTDIHASVEKDNVFACQFHPEKSSKWGLKILENFASIGKEETFGKEEKEGK